MWETVGVVKQERYLQFSTVEIGHSVSARCTRCDRVFLEKPKAVGERTDEIILRLRADFDAHDCHEDPSQAAARIVREATED